MKKHPFFFILVSVSLLACNTLVTPFPLFTGTPEKIPNSPISTDTFIAPPTVSQTEAPFNISWDDRSLFRQNLTARAQTILESLPGASIYHLALSITDPPSYVTGVEDVRYTNQEDISLTEVNFAVYAEILGGSIVVHDLKLDGQPVEGLRQAGLLRLPLPVPLLPGESVIIHLEFEVVLPTEGGNFYYGIFGYNEGILSLAHAYPTILVYDERGWNDRTPDLDGDPLFSDTSYYIISVDAPVDLVLVTSGSEVDRSEATGRQRVLYANGPARDFYLAASSAFIKQSETIGELTINSYAPAGLKAHAKFALTTAEAAIADFSARYSPYPYTEFDIVPIITSAGGVEFPGLTAVAQDVYNTSDFLEIVVTHEVGHQWFYNIVGNATQDQPWLDESLAEFVTWQYYLDRYGAQAAQTYQEELKSTWDILNAEKIPIGLPVSSYTSSGYVAIIYGRGPLFLLAMRDQMGREVFDHFISEYTLRYEWIVASTAGFKQTAENTCKCDLTPLFDSWVDP